MKTASVPMKAHLQGDCTTISTLYKIVRKDGVAFYFTDHDQDITFGGHTYEAAAGGLSQTAQESKSDLSPDNQEATAFIDSETITEADLRYGIWDAADVEIRWINWADVSMDDVKMRKGQLGNITMKNGVLTSEVLGLNNRLQIILGRSFGPTCDAELGDSRCQATVAVDTGTVNTNASIGENDAHHITPNSGLPGAVGFYDDGILTFTTGGNAGLSFQVGTWDGITLSLKNPLFVAPTNGDTFHVSPGCAHNIDDCKNKFNNLVNHRGFPTIPGQDSILSYPDVTNG